MKKILFISALILSIYSNAQNVKRIPGCIFKENKNIKEYIIPKTRGISETPVTFSIKEYYPPVGDQGLWGTCTAWATTYASFTALNNLKKNRLGDALKEEECFSPQFTYDLIKLGKDETCGNGSSMFTALDLLKRVGAIPLSEYPYNCNILKNGEGIERLKNNFADSSRLKGLISLAYKNRLNDFIDLGKTNVTEKIKYSLINTHPVVIGISDFDKIQTNLGKDFWIPEVVKYSSFGHAMSVVSYDDNKNGGSFEIMNSWGKNWGNSGYCWVRYVDLEKLIRTAYALTDMKDTEDKNEFYDYKLSIQLIGEDSKPFEFENDKEFDQTCPKVIYENEHYYVIIPYNSKLAKNIGYSGIRDYGTDIDNARKIFEINFPKCRLPNLLDKSKYKAKLDDCPFIMLKPENPCNQYECKNTDWKKGIPDNNNCKRSIDVYCSKYSDIDPACYCWKKENKDKKECLKWRGNFEAEDKCDSMLGLQFGCSRINWGIF